ncbi:MAG: hypothetical protein RLZ98_2571 [Pseudomonadota bacterium]|jgi:HCOMODA/2-hydroxy-3-carboxy-muconic semialdehyde decarboxylase
MSIVAECIYDLVCANRILGHEGVVDGFGHVSLRHPERPEHFLISRSRSPELVTEKDILEVKFNGDPVEANAPPLYNERFIHAAIYEIRSDVQAVIHNHAYEMIPFGVTGVPLMPIFHSAARMGMNVPVWDISDSFGDATSMLVTDIERGRDLAKGLGQNKLVLMRGHGATVASHSLYDAVLTSIFAHVNARLQQHAMAMGDVRYLKPGEIETMVAHQEARKASRDRQWEYYCRRAGCDPR